MKKDLVIFGPWCGEFCYELSWWIPEIRKQRNENFKDYDAFAVGYEGRKVLYQDFTDNYFGYTEDIEDTLTYPATYGQHRSGRDIIPDNLKEYVNRIADLYSKKYERICIYLPGTIPITRERTFAEMPYGEYRHYTASDEILKSVSNEIQFNNNRPTVAVMARIRKRLDKICYLDWNPANWQQFVQLLIDDLQVNVVMIGIPQKDGSSAGASLTFQDNDYIKNIIFTGSDSVERQMALLQLTKCSIYGASGTAVFPFFIKNAATFTQQTKQEGFRLMFQWERDLTDNLKNVKIFDKYDNYVLYDSPVNELYNEFKSFYQSLD